MSDQLKLGALIDEGANRDAIHIAVAPVIAAERLVPGVHIGFVKDGDIEHVGVRCQTLIGIVDPFLTAIVEHGQRFYMFLYPQTVTGLRHEWTHPAFGAQEPKHTAKELSEAWLRAFCDKSDCPSYDTVIAALSGKLADIDDYGRWGYVDEDYLHFSGRDAHGEIPPEFWYHVEVMLGKKLLHKPDSFSCSC